jgi:hypothetical protein
VTFLNAILLAGASALLVPLVIHLFHRAKPKQLYWGAMHLLEQALQDNKRRLNLENLLLLLIRCLIPLLLALCLSRPVFTKFSQLLGTAQSSVVVVVDDSYSMAATSAGQSAYDEAKEVVAELLDAAGRGSEVNVMRAGGSPRKLLENPTYDRVLVNRELGELEPVQGAGDWAGAVGGGIGLLAKMSEPVRDIIWVSDFQRSNFDDAARTKLNNLAGLVNDSPVQPRVVLYPVGDTVEKNVAVMELEHSTLLQGIGQSFSIRARIKNFGANEYVDLPVQLRVNGEEKSSSLINLASKEEQQVLFTHVFERVGSHLIEVSANAPDSLRFDNTRRASVPVWERLPVLLVNGEPSDEPLKGETDYLALALEPYQGGASNLIATTTVSAYQFTPDKLAGQSIVVLANVMQLNEATALAVRNFVEAGGALVVFPGNRINADWYNGRLGTEAGMLPLKYLSLEGEDVGRGTQVAPQRYDHPALDFFNDERNGKLSDAQIRIWYKTDPIVAPGRANGKIIAQLEGGLPFLAERDYGKGKVIQSVIPCDTDWSNMPLRPFFLPLMQRVMAYLATDVMPPRNLRPGQLITALFPGREAGRDMELLLPSGESVSVTAQEAQEQSLIEYGLTQDPGVYTLKVEPSPDIHFVVQPSFVESNLERLTENDLEGVAEQLGAKIVNSVDEFRALDRDQRFGREIWKQLLWLVLVLLFVEQLLQMWISRGKV